MSWAFSERLMYVEFKSCIPKVKLTAGNGKWLKLKFVDVDVWKSLRPSFRNNLFTTFCALYC